MKRFLLPLLFCVLSNIIIAQTTWTDNGADSNWNNIGNWNSGVVPTATDDVIIPSGSTVILNVNGFVKSINLEGTAVLEMHNGLTYTEPSIISANSTLNWHSGSLNGTTSTITNLGVINTISTLAHFISGDSTLENHGTINIMSTGDLIINSNGSVINNTINGIIDMQVDAGDISGFNAVGVLNNVGLIKKTTSVGNAQISTGFNNNNGIIQVEQGSLTISGGAEKNFTDGNFNVFAGAVMYWSEAIKPSGTLQGTVNGDLFWNDDIIIPVGEIATFNFSESDNFYWAAGTLIGGGTLINANVLKLSGTSVHNMYDATILENQGTLKIMSSADLVLSFGSTINNPLGGTIDMQANSGNIRWFTGSEGVINNAGLIKKTTSAGEAEINAILNNNNGTIQVEEGSLKIQGGTEKNFTDGTYNVFAGAIMNWSTTIRPLGTFEGTVAGNLNWNDDIIIPVGETATFNFSETDNFNWISGILLGGGTLINADVLKLTSTNAHNIYDATTLENQGILKITSSGDLVLNFGSILNNTNNGIIDMQANSGNIRWFTGATSVLNNAGLIKKTTTTGIAKLELEINNSGTITVETGELEITGDFLFTNEVSGIVNGIGILDLPETTYFTNNGTFAPGLSPGTLNIQGDFKSSSTSVLDIELDGLVAGTEYDVLAITGTNVEFGGIVNVTLGFEPSVNDEFIIATTTGIISTCNIANTTSADFNGNTYTFDVFCRNDNELVLGVNNITLGIDDNALNDSVSIYPNPIKNELNIKLPINSDGNWTLFNQLGQKVMQGQLQGLETKINTQTLNSGFYALQIIDENNRNVVVRKIIKS